VAAPVEQVGVIIACPVCGIEVLQKTMIPLRVLDGVVSYSCVSCARTLVTTRSVEGTG
jgi:DNA-directed RNA polymerase subunit RPC12/RpoP